MNLLDTSPGLHQMDAPNIKSTMERCLASAEPVAEVIAGGNGLRLYRRLMAGTKLYEGGPPRAPADHSGDADEMAVPQAGGKDDDECSAEDEWRRLALQFDGHRMQALSLLRLCIDQIAGNGPYAKLHAKLVEFNAAAPLDGEKVLAERIAALVAPQQSGSPKGAEVFRAWELHR